jgi:hypothetical protein
MGVLQGISMSTVLLLSLSHWLMRGLATPWCCVAVKLVGRDIALLCYDDTLTFVELSGPSTGPNSHLSTVILGMLLYQEPSEMLLGMV